MALGTTPRRRDSTTINQPAIDAGHDAAPNALCSMYPELLTPFMLRRCNSAHKDEFRKSEVIASGQSESLLVKPSSPLDDTRLIIRLHVPNMHPYQPDYDYLEVIHTFSPSLRSILTKLEIWCPESRNQVLVQDLYSRRLGKARNGAYRTLKNLNANRKVVDIHTAFGNDVLTECDTPLGSLQFLRPFQEVEMQKIRYRQVP